MKKGLIIVWMLEAAVLSSAAQAASCPSLDTAAAKINMARNRDDIRKALVGVGGGMIAKAPKIAALGGEDLKEARATALLYLDAASASMCAAEAYNKNH